MKVSEALAQAFGLVTVSGAYGHLALDKDGVKVDPLSPDACTYCSLGALCKVEGRSGENIDAPYSRGRYRSVELLAQAARAVSFGLCSEGWKLNDREPKLIPAMFKKAIELAKAEEGGCL